MRYAIIPLLLISPPLSFAQDSFEITPFGALTAGGEFRDSDSSADADLDEGASFGLILDIRKDANRQWEILYSRQSTTADTQGVASGDVSIDLDIHYLQAGGTVQFDGEQVRPYLAATIGAAYFDGRTPGYDDDTFFSFSIGPGLQIWPDKRFGLRLEARAYGTLLNSGSSVFCISNPGGGTAGCAINVSGDVLWQFQGMAGFVFRF